MEVNRRQFLKNTTMAVAAAASTMRAQEALAKADESKGKSAERKAGRKQVVPVNVGTGEALQQAMMRQAGSGGGIIRLAPGTTLTCVVRQDSVGGEASTHALLVPEGIELDLNGGNLLL